MRRLIMGAALLAVTGLYSGCTVYGAHAPEPFSKVGIELAENDFKVANTHLKGTAECTYLFGGIPIGGQPEITSKALGQIRDQATMDNRPVVLVNYTQDHSVTSYLGIIVKDKVTITCDALEWVK